MIQALAGMPEETLLDAIHKWDSDLPDLTATITVATACEMFYRGWRAGRVDTGQPIACFEDGLQVYAVNPDAPRGTVKGRR